MFRYVWRFCSVFTRWLTLSFSQVLSAYEFEQHAGAKTRHPNNHIFLENGRPIYSIIQEIKTAPLSLLDEVIKNVAGSSVNEESFQAWKGENHFSGKKVLIRNSCVYLNPIKYEPDIFLCKHSVSISFIAISFPTKVIFSLFDVVHTFHPLWYLSLP